MLQRFLCLLILLTPLSVLAAGKIYTWTDDDGNVYYGDRPPTEIEAEEITIQGKKREPVTVDESVLPGQWFGTDERGGEVKMTLNENGTVTFIHTRSDQSVYNYQGIWTYEDNSITVITEFSQTAPANGNFKRSVEPVQLTYFIVRFSSDTMELVIEDDRFTLAPVNL
ncbi:DUF4124 domain-containing protein [Reinekea blandensis]|uniref:DUF4124 domain-containing protein n=1 Tax=Reinekea blandensis MED297 TaxID=314283 RepID=A4BE80_9GAMM|nr:DUF4124 domain-containing protein [Reinekea blandensis]EAR09558.1 hypothetical protein MED297_12542 [Reinekea blandensis MED297]